jgi:hypothetical protein
MRQIPTMSDIGHGHIIRYSYLWEREYIKGEETGRKTRPACVMLIIAGPDRRKSTLIFPITSQPPTSDTMAIEIPDIEARRTGLRQPAWIVVQEFNVDDLSHSFALEDTKPIGRFSQKFMSTLAGAAAAAMRAGRSRGIPRK